MSGLGKDLRYAIRALRRSPGFTLVAVATLALGVGANTAIFSVVRGVLLNPLPFADPAALVMVRELHPRSGAAGIHLTPNNFVLLREQASSFQALGAYDNASFNLTGRAEPERLRGAKVTADLLPLLGVAPSRGRLFRADEVSGRRPVALLAHALWQRRFASDPNLVGQTILLDGEAFTVVGIMPSGFRFPVTSPAPDLWVPLDIQRFLGGEMENGRFLKVVGRLARGRDMARTKAELRVLAARLRAQSPVANDGLDLAVFPLHERVVGGSRPALLVLLAAVGVLLLIACANVANLLLARGAGRRREIATRLALGASRGRIVRQLLTESLFLSMIGGLLGSFLAAWALSLFLSLAPANIPRLDEIGLDARVLLFALATALATGALFGLAPAFQGSRAELDLHLKEAGRGTSESAGRLRRWLVACEIALALVLLTAAGLLGRSFLKLRATDPGFRPEHVLTFETTLPERKYEGPESISDLFERILDRVSALPGVRAVGASTHFPFGNRWRNPVSVEGKTAPNFRDLPLATISPVTPGYFGAMGISLQRGRSFDSRDREQSLKVAVVDEAAARTLFGGEDPVGKRLKLGRSTGSAEWLTVVGVVATVRDNPQAVEIPEVYFPFRQLPPSLVPVVARSMTFAVRAEGEPLALVPSILGQVRSVDHEQPISNIAPLEDLLIGSRSQQRFSMLLLALFGGLAILLAAVGLYGVISYSVTRRTREIGIRTALGAASSDIFRMVVGEGMAVSAIGLVAGLAAALLLTRFLSRLLFGIAPTDLATFLSTSGLLLSVAFFASWLPARRAARIAPMEALRHE